MPLGAGGLLIDPVYLEIRSRIPLARQGLPAHRRPGSGLSERALLNQLDRYLGSVPTYSRSYNRSGGPSVSTKC